MKKSEKQEQNQGEVEDEGADRKYQVFNFFFGTKVFEIGFDAYNVLSLLHLMHPWYMYQVTFCYNLPFCVLFL